MLTVGKKAPAFTLKNEDGESVKLSQFKGKKIVLYFYPRDNTSGCTTEACAFRDVYDDILDKGAVVIGISPDSESSHAKFKAKHALPFYLLADPEKEVIQKYEAWGEKSMFGKKYFGVVRSTYIIDEEGKITHVFPKVSPKNHAAEILAAL
ncbi:thioredoxin-dependent thiol peroxidase [Treponema phagedenis]|uniref:thioredoxin-dependent peroxiredoxin n=1 Tax=Treponema phagedenis TaxID=162 RepID=A0A0B7H0Z3_TREPH|nr:thioredoxin-dependent thiol peroxidase [Treponema phagedenis]EFW38168.1 antioxidant, AhpC/TSA family [Treponema phagedenis F0421]QEJ97587.1 thioredoxin-dependent thiol peroxidase [Treponema phagedenis]QEK00554.1 thioredoxin-dependent thiol peroxidase [Treponema phagedenis]QEK03153.1 thioredoxin-dependent thiol peroxidase [Treponema phagedenis]QEK05562.1 thioredoxin-dependent thiol peroxidase [Treponema phagedenis]